MYVLSSHPYTHPHLHPCIFIHLYSFTRSHPHAYLLPSHTHITLYIAPYLLSFYIYQHSPHKSFYFSFHLVSINLIHLINFTHLLSHTEVTSIPSTLSHINTHTHIHLISCSVTFTSH